MATATDLDSVTTDIPLPAVGDTGSRMTIPSPSSAGDETTTPQPPRIQPPASHHMAHHVDENTPLHHHPKDSKMKLARKMAKKGLKAVGEFLGINETEEHMRLWKDRMTEMAKTDHIGIHMTDVNMKKEHPQADVVFTLKKVLENVADDPEEERRILETEISDDVLSGTQQQERSENEKRKRTRQLSRALIHDMTADVARPIHLESAVVATTSAVRDDLMPKGRHLPGVETHHANKEIFGSHRQNNTLLDEIRQGLATEKFIGSVKAGEVRTPKGDELEIVQLHRLSTGYRADDMPTSVQYSKERERFKKLQKIYTKGLQDKKSSGLKSLLGPCFNTCAKKKEMPGASETVTSPTVPTPSSLVMQEQITATTSAFPDQPIKAPVKERAKHHRQSSFENIGPDSMAVLERMHEDKDEEPSFMETALTGEETDLQLQNEELAKKGLKPLPPGADPKDFAYRKEALDYYREFIEMEENEKREIFEARKKRMIERLIEKQEVIAQALEIGREFYCQGKVSHAVHARHPHGSQSHVSIESHHHHIRHIRKQLEDLNVFRPWFIGIITVLQLIVLIVAIAVGGVTTISVDPVLELKDDVTFEGPVTVHHWFLPNVWIGPPMEALIGMGAVYGLCMRADTYLEVIHVKSRDRLTGCCQLTRKNIAGTTTVEECTVLTSGIGEWYRHSICSKRPPDQDVVTHNLKPCCYITNNLCRLTSKTHCDYLNGKWHKDADHCSEINCLKDICNLGFGSASDNFTKFYTTQRVILHNQWFRFPFSLLLHFGIIHFVLVAIIQVLVGAQIEKLAGWLRIGLIYIISGLMALVAAGLFGEYHPQCGAMGSVFGLLGVQSVELMQSWKIIAKPWRELAKLAGIIAILLMAGTYSFIDNIGNVLGYIFGIICGILFLPFITFGKWDAHRKRLLILITWPIALIAVFVLHYSFYWVQHMGCDGCRYFSCIPFTEHTCQSYTKEYLLQDDLLSTFRKLNASN